MAEYLIVHERNEINIKGVSDDRFIKGTNDFHTLYFTRIEDLLE